VDVEALSTPSTMRGPEEESEGEEGEHSKLKGDCWIVIVIEFSTRPEKWGNESERGN
jgi:hypothetical protein